LFVYTVKALFIDAETLPENTIRHEKRQYLGRLMDRGFLELDALLDPVEEGIPRDRLIRNIRNGFDNLIDRIVEYDGERKRGIIDRNTRIVLIKKTVFQAIGPDLWFERGFSILNDIGIDFPSNGWQLKFLEAIGKLPIEKL